MGDGWRRVRRVVTGVLGLAVLWIGAAAVAVAAFGAWDRARSADVAIVLGSSVYGSHVSPVFAGRLEHAIFLYRQHTVKKILVTGGMSAGNARADSEVGRDFVVRAGVPAGDVLVETRSRTTLENLSEAQAVMQRDGMRSAVVVSDPMHLARAALMARQLGMDAVTSPASTSRFKGFGPRTDFMMRELRLIHWFLLGGK